MYFNFLTKPTTITVLIMLTIIPYCPKIFPFLLIPSPFVHWWDISVKSTQTFLWLKEGSFRRVLRLFLVPVGGWQGYWRSVDWEGTMVMMRVQELGEILEGETVNQ